MRPIWTVLLYVTAVFSAGALIAPWLYWSAEAMAHHAIGLSEAAGEPFHRYISRAILGSALLGLWPVARYSGIRTWREVGLWRSPGRWGQLGRGAFLGFISLALIAFLALLFDVRRWNPRITMRHMEESVLRALIAALVVAVLEELIFRGVLFGALRKGHTRITALLVSSGIYALVHFFKAVHWQQPLTWHSGLQVLGQMLVGFIDLPSLIPQFFVLFLAGMILALGFEKTGALWFSIGAHAGWIFWLKIYGVLTVENSPKLLSFWGTSKLTDGWFAALVLLGTAVILWERRPITATMQTSDVRVS